MAEAISLAKELNDMYGLAVALRIAADLARMERNLADVERYSSDLIELSTRHHFALWIATGAVYRGWARSASGETSDGISWIEDGTRNYRATGAVLDMPNLLTLMAEALYLANRTSEALEALKEAEALAKRFDTAFGVPNCTGCAVCFSRLWVPTTRKLMLHFRQPSTQQRGRSRCR